MQAVNLDSEMIDKLAMAKISFEVAKRYGVFPMRMQDGALVVAMSDPGDIMALDDISKVAGIEIYPVVARKGQISDYIERCYQVDNTLYDLFKNIGPFSAPHTTEDDGQAPVVKLIDIVFRDAIRARASDIHIEPQQSGINLRYRIDGYLKDIFTIPLAMQNRIAARIKVLGELDIAESRKSQDGRMSVEIESRKIDVRISIIPTFYGEKIVLRLLDLKEAKVTLSEIGFRQQEKDMVIKASSFPQGMVLVTGPTGSGKTSTLYAILNHIKGETKNIVTIEDPVEYLIDGLNQMQVNPVKDMTFSNGLRSILRQDPNVVLVGEIRDRDTADIAFRASLTGHLVFSTLHTNSAVASIERLFDIGLEPYLVASSLILIVSQRLVRLICPQCKAEYSPDISLIERFKISADKFYAGRGCSHCDFTGFYGRTAIFEILSINEKMRSLISNRAQSHILLEEAGKAGFLSLSESARQKVVDGLTTVEEIARIIVTNEPVPAEVYKDKNAKTRILIVDDEEVNSRLASECLKQDGYEIMIAQDGVQAVELVARERPDLVVMDVQMPRMNGFEAVKILRSQLASASTPIVMLTSMADKESELIGINMGADDYITKPFDGDKLRSRIKMLLRRSKGARSS
jgi:type IV pilus assembly protein PilB